MAFGRTISFELLRGKVNLERNEQIYLVMRLGHLFNMLELDYEKFNT